MGTPWHDVAKWAGLDLTPDKDAQLVEYRRWLSEEAIPAGALGPREEGVIGTRHLGDSLAFARGWVDRTPPGTLVDLGSGAGLPGIPLGIVLPATHVTLVDRSGRRVRLLERAVRVLGLDHVEVVGGDIDQPFGPFDAVVSRATRPPLQLAAVAGRWATEGAPVVVGGSTRTRPDVPGWTTVEIPAAVLDSGGWLLMMAGPVRRS